MNDYVNEKRKFYLLELICNDQNSKVMTDHESYLIGRISEKDPTWIWTKDNITDEEFNKIKDAVKAYIT